MKSNPRVVKRPQVAYIASPKPLNRMYSGRTRMPQDRRKTPSRGHPTLPLASEPLPSQTWDQFISKVKSLLEPTANEKGYNSTGVNGKNELYEFVHSHAPGHALGEIIYKAVRYGRKRDKQDILKIAAWAYLIWKFDNE